MTKESVETNDTGPVLAVAEMPALLFICRSELSEVKRALAAVDAICTVLAEVRLPAEPRNAILSDTAWAEPTSTDPVALANNTSAVAEKDVCADAEAILIVDTPTNKTD